MTSPPLPPNAFGPAGPPPVAPSAPPPDQSGPPPVPTIALPTPAMKNSATRHLCAAAYIDRPFRDAVIDEVYSRTDRAIAPNPGIDAVPILRHARYARTLDVVQQAILAAAFLFLLCGGLVYLPFLLRGLFLLALIGIPVLVAESRSGTPTGSISAAALARVNWARVTLIGLGIVVAWYLLVKVLPAALREAFFGEPSSASEDGGADLAGGASAETSYFFYVAAVSSVVICMLVLGAVTGTIGVLRARGLMAVPSEFEPAGPVDARAHFIGQAQHSPVVTYHSGRTPFVGSGYALATWQLAMTLHPADEAVDGGSGVTIDTVGLNRRIRERIERLGRDSAITKRLPGLILGDHVYVSGRDTTGPVFYPGELPNSGYMFESIEQIQADPTTPVRHYLRCTVDSWGGELVTTVFIHCALQGEALYVEFSSCVLPPTPQRYHVFGVGAASKGMVMFLGFLRGLAGMPIDFLRSPYDSIRNAARGIGTASRGGAGGAGDHGAIAGIRELGTAVAEQGYFQYRDSVKYSEILERQILDALLDYLRENNVDVSELDERANAIVNNGVINYGKLQTGAAGAGASANVGAVGDKSRGTANGGKS